MKKQNRTGSRIEEAVKSMYLFLGKNTYMVFYGIKRTLQYKKIDDVISKDISYSLIVTNDIKGGTYKFESEYISRVENPMVLRRRSFAENSDIIYTLENKATDKQIFLKIEEYKKIWNYKYKEIIINSMVNTSEIISLFCDIIEYSKENDCKVIVMLHDYYALCPCYNLFINGHNCDVKCDEERCDLKFATSLIKDIRSWRRLWRDIFDVCDEIRCFSHSSKYYFIKAYGNTYNNKLTVKPHDISYIRFQKIKSIDKLPIKVGIVGDCRPEPKGRFIIERFIEDMGDEIPITIIGPYYRFRKIKKEKVKYYGSYVTEKLQNIIEEEMISIIFFPSICAETFSFTISELMAMDIPILGFDIGAQGEKLRAYQKGRTFKQYDEVVAYIRALCLNNE